jgi:phage gp46-like protein
MIKLISDLTTGQLSAEGKIKLDAGIETSIFISLFGGNVGGVTTASRNPAGVENKDYFGNLYLKEIGKPLFNSKFEKYLKENPLTTGNLKKLNELVLGDLEWLVKNKAVKSFEIDFEIESANQLKIEIIAKQPNNTEKKYQYLWSR